MKVLKATLLVLVIAALAGPIGDLVSRKALAQLYVPGHYVIQFATTVGTVADDTVYYWGPFAVAHNTTEGLNRYYIPVSGTIRNINLIIVNDNANATDETGACGLRQDATTDHVITATASYTLAVNGPYALTGQSIAVTANSTFFEMKCDPPSFSTNPTNTRHFVSVAIQTP